ncbi:MAG: hypothetical protein KAT26_11535 [Marinosulfonomonas sp.]|nr:hypothetical protein [Marinosulfonomonas sp.]
MCSDNLNLKAALNLDDNAYTFVCVVIRFEFSLKECGFCISDRNAAVKADWQEFARTLDEDFFKQIEADKRVKEMFNPAPRQQIISHGSLDWREKKPATNNQELLDAVKRVRNNLLHGGKSAAPDEYRNPTLVKEALFILTEAIKRGDIVRNEFERLY